MQHVVSGRDKQFNAADRNDIIGYTLVTPGNPIDNNTKHQYENHPVNLKKVINKVQNPRDTKF